MGRVKGECLHSYFVRRFYVFRYPTAHSHPCKLTSEILSLSDVENIILWGRYTITPRYLQCSYLGWACRVPHAPASVYVQNYHLY